MNKKIFYLFSAALLIGGLTGCSSSDDVGSEANQVNPTRIGEALDDITSQMQSSIFNCNQAKSRTRAASDIDAQIPKENEVSFNNAVPSNAVDITEGNPAIYNPGGTWLVPKGKTSLGKGICGGNGTTIYVEGTLEKPNIYTDKATIIVKKGGKLILGGNGNRISGNGGTLIVEEGGTLETPSGELQIANNEKIYIKGDFSCKKACIQGTLYVDGNLTAEGFYSGNTAPNQYYTPPIMNGDTRLYVSGKLTSTDADLYTDGYIRVGGDIDAGSHAIYFQNTTHLIADCGIKANLVEVNSNKAEIHVNYIKCANFNQWATSKVYLNDKGLIDIDNTYTNKNNGNNAAIIMEGDGAMGVVKAAKISFNGSGSPETLKDCYFIQTSGSQKAGVDCNIFNFGTGDDADFTKVNFVNGTVEHISEGKVLDASGKVSDEVKYSIPADGCHGNGYVPSKPGTPDTPDTPDTPENPQPYVVSESHTHDISATCVQTDGTNVYVSYHKRGNGRSGCLEMLSTTGDVTTLKQFVRDHDNAIDFNHITLDKSDKRLYAVGNNKNGGFLGYVRLTDGGMIDCTSQKMGDLDSTEIAHKTYEPLQLVKLYQAQQVANGNASSKNGGDGNCVIVNGDNLQVASTYGYEVYDKDLNAVSYQKTAGRAKHLCFSPENSNVFAIHYDDTAIQDSMTEVGLVLDKFNSNDATMQSPTFSVKANSVKPNNGKNAMCVYDGKIYVCQSMNGLYVYDAATGAQVDHYKENIYSESLGHDLAICANGVAVDDKYVYIAYGSRGLVVLDRNTLKKVSSFVGQRSANYVTLAGGYIYVAYGRDCLKVFKLM